MDLMLCYQKMKGSFFVPLAGNDVPAAGQAVGASATNEGSGSLAASHPMSAKRKENTVQKEESGTCNVRGPPESFQFQLLTSHRKNLPTCNLSALR